MKKSSFSLVMSILWLIVAIVFLAEGKTWAAIVDLAGSIAFFILFLYYKRRSD